MPNRLKELNENEIISLMDVYLSEWMHRDELLWKQVFALFYANLIVMLLPYMADLIHMTLPINNNNVFHMIGIFMALVSMYIGIGYAVRLRASSLSYERLMEALDKKYRRISINRKDDIKDIKGLKYAWLFKCQISILLVFVMFLSLILLGLALMLII